VPCLIPEKHPGRPASNGLDLGLGFLVNIFMNFKKLLIKGQEAPRHNRFGGIALRTSLLYAAIASLWILFSSELLHALVTNPATAASLEIYKGLGFVLVTAGLLYLSLRRQLRRQALEAAELTAERKRAEEYQARMAAIIESSHNAIISETPEGMITSWNPGAEKIFGYSSGEAIGQSSLMLFPPELWGDQRDSLLNIARGEKIDHPETVRLRKGGKKVQVSVSVSPIKDPRGNVTGASIIARNIAERLQLEAQLRQSQKMEAVGTLAGGIAHDFNNILAAIMGNADLLRMDFPPDHPHAELLQQILAATYRAKALVQQILSFSQCRENKMGPVSLQVVVRECLALLRSTIPAMVGIKYNIASDCSPVLADSTQIHQIIMNLCTNAWQALPERGGVIEVNLEMCEIDAKMAATNPDLRIGQYVRLSIRDNGCGMDQATLERIFEPFFTTKPAGKGTGLGLSVVHGIVKIHRGVIIVSSKPGKGTVFHIHFPAQAMPEAKAPEINVPTLLGNGQRILLVDDEEWAGRTMKKVLSRMGYQVHWSDHPREALARFGAAPAQFDLVVSDSAMPEMSGFDLAAGLLQIRRDIPILLITGLIDSAGEERARQIGIRHVLLKPANAQVIGRVIARLLDAQKSEPTPKA
jgi:PAS domain S-box-containing protein